MSLPAAGSKLLECCCFGDRVFRFERRRALVNATGLCDGDAGTFDPDATLARYRRAKFVFSPRGEGCSNYREFEALYAGAIPVVAVAPGMGGWSPTADGPLPRRCAGALLARRLWRPPLLPSRR